MATLPLHMPSTGVLQMLLLGLLALYCLPMTEANFRICGFKLTITLQSICRNQVCGGFQPEQEPMRKRSYAEIAEALANGRQDTLIIPANVGPAPPSDPAYSSSSSSSSSSTEGGDAPRQHPLIDFYYQVLQPRKRSGVATMCCKKRCSLAYLRTYCCSGFDLAA